jgi:hypothetical protein
MNKPPINRPTTFREHLYVPKPISNQPIDAIRLQLADYENPYKPCPVHHSHREHPYITTFSDQQSSIRRTRSSIHSISTIETDFVHQYILFFLLKNFFSNKIFRRVSTIHTYPSSPSIMERQEIIDEDNDNINIDVEDNQINNNENEINQPINADVVQQQEQQPQQQQLNESSQVNIKYNKEINFFFFV